MTMKPPELDQLLDQPELELEIAGKTYRFAELPIEQLARLQSFIRRTLPHPIEAVKPHLAGLSDRQADCLLEQARQDGRDWPPQAGTAEGVKALMGTRDGQLEALAAALSVFHADLSPSAVRQIFRQLSRETTAEARAARRGGKTYDGEGKVRRIFAVAFGMGDPDLDDGTEPLPESAAPAGPAASTGA